MLSVLYPNIDWKNIEIIGFDLDGTLYDEFDFIVQAYGNITDSLLKHFGNKKQPALNYMKTRWIEKGSSYNKIFEETYDRFVERNSLPKEQFIRRAVHLFRTTQPLLALPERTRWILDYCQKHYCLFLITDGNEELQKNKFKALGLRQFFKREETIFTGQLGKQFYKPSPQALDKLQIHLNKKTTLYIGDRDIDKTFAGAAGLNFLPVYNMIPTKLR